MQSLQQADLQTFACSNHQYLTPLRLLLLAADYVVSRVWPQSVLDTVSLSYLPPSAPCPRNDRNKKSSLAFWKKEITRMGRTCCRVSSWARNTVVITTVHKCLQLGTELPCANEVCGTHLSPLVYASIFSRYYVKPTLSMVYIFLLRKLLRNIADVKASFPVLSLGTGRKALLLPNGDLPASLYLVGCLGCKSRILARLAGPAQTAVSGSACLPQ